MTLEPGRRKFANGDVVRLMCGGPSMTVGDYIHPQTGKWEQYRASLVPCMWFDGLALRSGTFSEGALRLWPAGVVVSERSQAGE